MSDFELHAVATIAVSSAFGTNPILLQRNLFCILPIPIIQARIKNPITRAYTFLSNNKSQNINSNLFNMHLVHNLIGHVLSFFLVTHDPTRSVLFCRHYKHKTIDSNINSNIVTLIQNHNRSLVKGNHEYTKSKQYG